MIYPRTITHIRPASAQPIRRKRRHPIARLSIAIIHALLTLLVGIIGAAIGYAILILLGGYGS